MLDKIMRKSIFGFVGVGMLMVLLIFGCEQRTIQQERKPAQPNPLQNTQISLTMTREQLTPELVAAVAKIGLASHQKLDAGTDILETIATRCGRANAVGPYLAHFVAVNENIEEIRSGQFIIEKSHEVLFPACLPIDDIAVPINVPVKRRKGPNFEQAVSVIEPDSIILSQPDKGVLYSVASGLEYAQRYGLESLLATTGPSGRTAPSLTSRRLKDPQFAKALQPWLDTGQQAIEILNQGGPEDISTEVVADVVSQKIKGNSVGQWAKTKAVMAAQDALLANPELVFTKLQATTRFETVGTSKQQVVSFNLPSGVSPSILEKVLQSGVTMYAAEGLEPIFSFPQGGTVCTPTGKAIKEAEWPVPVSQLLKILEMNAAVYKSKQQGFLRKEFGKILVFDTGFPPSKMENEPFGVEEFTLYRQAQSLAQTDPIVYNKFLRVIDLVGTDPNSGIAKADASPFDPTAKQAGHGIAVVTLALGGLNFLESLKAEPRKHLLNSETGRVIVARGYAYNNYGQFTATPANIRNVTEKEGWRGTEPTIVNLSLKYLASAGTNIINSFDHQENVIFVLAAGNRYENEKEGRDIGDYPILPAILGGQRSTNVITVGAHDVNGNPGNVSNYSDVHVDLAAPGCDVPVYDWDHQNNEFIKTMESGTSLAAPLVSFTLGILHSYGLDTFESKRRVLGAADYRPSWREKSATSAILNIPKAVATHFDVIETISGELLFGSLDWHPTEGEFVCGKTLLRDALLKITVTGLENDKVSVRIMRQNQLIPAVSNYWYRECDLNMEEDELSSLTTFKEASLDDSGRIHWSERAVAISEVRDITFCSSKECLLPLMH
jgi:hypothetical protein